MASEIEKLNRVIRRRRRKRVFAFLLVCLVIAVVISALTRIFLRVEIVSVENSSKYESALILKTCDDLRGEPILQLDRDLVCDNLCTDLPYIKSASFSVSFPDRLNIVVTPAIPEYSVSVENGYICLDSDFKVLEESNVKFQNVVNVDGLDIETYEVGKNVDLSENIEASVLYDLIASLKKYGLQDQLTNVDFSKKYNLSFVLNDIIQVEFGTSEDFDKKTEMLVEILSRNPSDKRALINVRNYTEGRYRALD